MLGRVLVALVTISAMTGLFFGAVIPLTRFGERSSTAFFGALILIAVAFDQWQGRRSRSS